MADRAPSERGRLLIVPGLRNGALIAISLATLVTVVLAVRFAGQDSPGRFDRAVDDLMALSLRNELFNSIDTYFLQLGDAKKLITLVFVVALAAALANRLDGALLVIIGTVAAAVLGKLVIKPVVGRHYGDVLSYPSTHVSTMATVAITSVIMILGARRPMSLALRLLACVIPLAVALTASVAIVAERTHYTTDAIGGWCLAVVTALTTALAIDMVSAARRRPPKTVSESA